jgi:hypothetical protein
MIIHKNIGRDNIHVNQSFVALHWPHYYGLLTIVK